MPTFFEWVYDYNRSCKKINKILEEMFENKKIDEAKDWTTIAIYAILPSGERIRLEQPIKFESIEVRGFIQEEE